MSATSLLPGTPPSPLDWRKQFLERKYREVYLPEMHDPFEVDGIPLSPAEALQKCRPDQYQSALTEYARHEGEAALESACESFPAPIALALYRALYAADSEHERLLHYRDTAEALILVLLAITIGECRGKGVKLSGLQFPGPNGNLEDFTAKKLVNESVAHRLAMLEGLLSGLAGNAALACPRRFSQDAVKRLSELNDIRNDFSHYQTKAEPAARLICQDMREQLADAMLAFEWLSETRLVTFAGAVTGKPNVARLEVQAGNGQNRPKPEFTLAASAMQKCQSIVTDQLDRPMFHWDGQLFEATPFLHTKLTTNSLRRHIWLLRRRFHQADQFQFEIAGEGGELQVLPDSAPTVEFRVLEELFM
jgi:hypothetical protein